MSIPRRRDDNQFDPQEMWNENRKAYTKPNKREHLTNTVMFSPFDLPSGVILLVTDELASPADFFLHQSLISHVKEKKGVKSIVLSISESLVRWQAIAAKSVRLPPEICGDYSHGPEECQLTSTFYHWRCPNY
jgi:hypothetical protein